MQNLSFFFCCVYFGNQIWWMTWFVWSDFEALPGERPDGHTRLTKVNQKESFWRLWLHVDTIVPKKYLVQHQPIPMSTPLSERILQCIVWYGAAFLHQSAVWTHPLEKWQCEHILLVLVSQWKHFLRLKATSECCLHHNRPLRFVFGDCLFISSCGCWSLLYTAGGARCIRLSGNIVVIVV